MKSGKFVSPAAEHLPRASNGIESRSSTMWSSFIRGDKLTPTKRKQLSNIWGLWFVEFFIFSRIMAHLRTISNAWSAQSHLLDWDRLKWDGIDSHNIPLSLKNLIAGEDIPSDQIEFNSRNQSWLQRKPHQRAKENNYLFARSDRACTLSHSSIAMSVDVPKIRTIRCMTIEWNLILLRWAEREFFSFFFFDLLVPSRSNSAAAKLKQNIIH